MSLAEEFREVERFAWQRAGGAPRERRISLPGLEVRALEAGEGRAALFVHGGGGFASTWLPLLAGWQGGRAVAIDRPGHGLSGAFCYRGVDLRRHAVEVLTGVLDALGIDQVDLVGNSMGGLWSFWLALDRPARVRRVVQLGCPALILETSAPLPMRLLSKPWLARLMARIDPPSPASMRRVFTRMGHDASVLSDELCEMGAAAARLPAYEDAWFSLLESALTLRGARVSLPAEELRRVRQPVLFLWGARDPFGDVAVGRRACALMPRATLEEIGVGHLPWLDEPERCRRAIEQFLAESATAAA